MSVLLEADVKHRETEADSFPSETPILETRGVKHHNKDPSGVQLGPVRLEDCFFLLRLCRSAFTSLQCWVSGPPLDGKGRNVVGRTAASVRQQAAFV